MGLSIPAARAALEVHLASAAKAARAEITALEPLSGGTLHENWRLAVTFDGGALPGSRQLVLRADRPVVLADSLTRGEEFQVMNAVRAAGVAVPEPLWAAAAAGPLGREFFVMRWARGTASPEAIIRQCEQGDSGARLAARLGAELAMLQRIRPEAGTLPFLKPPAADRAQSLVAAARAYLDTQSQAHPAIEWGLRWLELNAPPAAAPVLVHGDFRTGNYLVDGVDLVAILDWELAAWGDPLEDLGWFCMRFWRLGAADRIAGGLADREALLAGYERARGQAVERAALQYWEVMANVRWATISIQQAERHLSGVDRSLELCLIGRRTAEIEHEFMQLISAVPEGRRSHA